jgi:heme oxygenase (biliverdin-IX-beta and delta-forming)
MNILTRLKTETRTQHEKTERLLYADKLLAGTLSRHEYEHLLLIHYAFHQALETAVASHGQFFADYGCPVRQKTSWLIADLQQAGCQLPPPFSGLFADWNRYALLGALYVAEGSTLGGRVIAGALYRTQELRHIVPHFFGGYGEQTGPLWKAFCAYLIDRADGQDDTIVSGAERAFSLFQQLALRRVSPTPIKQLS